MPALYGTKKPSNHGDFLNSPLPPPGGFTDPPSQTGQNLNKPSSANPLWMKPQTSTAGHTLAAGQASSLNKQYDSPMGNAFNRVITKAEAPAAPVKKNYSHGGWSGGGLRSETALQIGNGGSGSSGVSWSGSGSGGSGSSSGSSVTINGNTTNSPNVTPQNFNGGGWLNTNTSGIASQAGKLSDYYSQLSGLTNTQKIDNPYEYATNQIMSSGSMDPIIDKINQVNRTADPWGSSITNEKIAGEVGAAMAGQIGNYANQLSSQQFQGGQNQIKLASDLYADAQKLAQQGRTDEANLALQQAQLMQSSYQFENSENYNQWLSNRKLELQQQGMSADQANAQAQLELQNQQQGMQQGGTNFMGNAPWLSNPFSGGTSSWDENGYLTSGGGGAASAGGVSAGVGSGVYGGSDDYSTSGGTGSSNYGGWGVGTNFSDVPEWGVGYNF